MSSVAKMIIAAGPEPGSPVGNGMAAGSWSMRHFEQMRDAIRDSTCHVTLDGQRTASATVGKVIDAHTDPDDGFVYEMEIYDEGVADELIDGSLHPAPLLVVNPTATITGANVLTVQDVDTIGIYDKVDDDIIGVIDNEEVEQTLSDYLGNGSI